MRTWAARITCRFRITPRRPSVPKRVANHHDPVRHDATVDSPASALDVITLLNESFERMPRGVSSACRRPDRIEVENSS